MKTPKTFSTKYYQENIERQQKQAHERNQNLSKEEKEKKPQYGVERMAVNKNLSENEKQKLVKYRKNCCRLRKNSLL